MPDDDRFQANDEERDSQPPESGEVPASLIFMEMMRRKAADNAPPPAPSSETRSESFEPTPAPEETPITPDSVLPVTETVEQNRQRYEAQMTAQRVQRVKRRRARRRRQTVGVLGGFFRTLLIVTISAGLMATIFSFWTDSQYFAYTVRTELQVALATSQVTAQPTGLPTPPWLRRIGIVSGHRGPENDPGAVCPDGLTEREVNFNIAQLVVRSLRGRGYSVELLDEFDPRLNDYQAAALISIHANTCQDWGEWVSGYLVAKASARPEGGEDVRLAECIAQYYGQASGLDRRTTLTEDMTNYHTFREIHPLTPAAIIELGFMLADRSLMTDQSEELADGITDGILCFLEPGATLEPSVTPPPSGG